MCSSQKPTSMLNLPSRFKLSIRFWPLGFMHLKIFCFSLIVYPTFFCFQQEGWLGYPVYHTTETEVLVISMSLIALYLPYNALHIVCAH